MKGAAAAAAEKDMIFAPVAIAEHKMTVEDLRSDIKNCVRTGPCGIGEKAVYLNSFFIDRRYYVMWQDIQRVRFWRENAVVLLYRPRWWQAMFINCPIEEWEEVEKMVRQKLKPRKEVVQKVRIEG